MSDNPFANLTDNPYQSPVNDGSRSKRPRGKKTRHGCLMAWLGLLILVNTAVVGMVIFAAAMGVIESQQDALQLGWGVISSTGMIICSILVWNFKKFGFYGIAALAVINAGVEVLTAEGPQDLKMLTFGFLGVAALYGVLQIGKPTGWEQLQ